MKKQILTFAIVATIIGSLATGCSSSEKATTSDSVSTTTTTDSTVTTPTDTSKVTDTTRRTM